MQWMARRFGCDAEMSMGLASLAPSPSRRRLLLLLLLAMLQLLRRLVEKLLLDLQRLLRLLRSRQKRRSSALPLPEPLAEPALHQQL